MSDPPPDPARWRGLAVCLIAGAMTLLDLSIVNVALPSLRASLGADDSDLQWIVAGYALAFGVLLVAGRPAGRRPQPAYGLRHRSGAVHRLQRRRGAAPNPTLLAVARVLQGIGRRADHPAGLRVHPEPVPRARARQGLRPVRRDRQRLHRDRSTARRAAGRSRRTRPGLAAGLLRQRAHRGGADPAGPPAAAAATKRPANVSRWTRSGWRCSPPRWSSSCCRWSRKTRTPHWPTGRGGCSASRACCWPGSTAGNGSGPRAIGRRWSTSR